MLPILPLILGLAPEIARWIGGNQAAGVTSAVASAVRNVTGTDDPEQAAKAIAADAAKAADLRVQLAKIAAEAETAQREAELEALKTTLAAANAKQQMDLDALRASVADISSARQQTLELAKSGSVLAWGTPVLSAIILIAFGVIIYVILAVKINDSTLALANVLVGTLAALATQVANYWLGSSSGSVRKESVIQSAQEQLARSVPASVLPRPSAVLPASAIPDGDLVTEELNRASLSRAQGS
jgi:hypothetical protein